MGWINEEKKCQKILWHCHFKLILWKSMYSTHLTLRWSVSLCVACTFFLRNSIELFTKSRIFSLNYTEIIFIPDVASNICIFFISNLWKCPLIFVNFLFLSSLCLLFLLSFFFISTVFSFSSPSFNHSYSLTTWFSLCLSYFFFLLQFCPHKFCLYRPLLALIENINFKKYIHNYLNITQHFFVSFLMGQLVNSTQC